MVWKSRMLSDKSLPPCSFCDSAKLFCNVLSLSKYVVFWLFTYLKYFIIGENVDWKRSRSSSDTKIIAWLPSASVIHDFKLNCYSQLWIKCSRGKNQAGGISASPGSFKSGSMRYILREHCRWHWRMFVQWGNIIYCQTTKQFLWETHCDVPSHKLVAARIDSRQTVWKT